MADIICRWRNGTPKTVVELVNSLPHVKMTNESFRLYMQDSKWGNEFFHTPYQLACQLGLYCEAENGYYYPRFDHDITEHEAQEYLEYWMPRYYVPNPYVGRNGFNDIKCPTYVLFELYGYASNHLNCSFKEAYETVFKEKPTNNNDIVKNYINNYSKILRFEADGRLVITHENPNATFNFMDRNSKKDYFDNFSKINERQKIKFPLQQIYYGAPGTGKSHEINTITAGMLEENVFRTTFHPDSDYSTFVGCYKPTKKKNSAVSQTIVDYSTLVDILRQRINTPAANITKECVTFGYEFHDSIVKMQEDFSHTIPSLIVDAYKSGSTYDTQVRAGMAVFESYGASICSSDSITYSFVPQVFLKAYIRAFQTTEPVILVIEEINRGNCAQIFGDLFQLLDRNKEGFSEYPIKADDDICEYLKAVLGADSKAIANDEICLPPNLYIWATMNTSDQSLFPIDSAFKRRWDWKYMPINTKKENWSISVNGKMYSWSSFLDKINYEIGDQTSSEDKKLGFYFCKAENGEISAERFVSKVLFYIYNDVFKDYEFDRDFFKRKSDNKVIAFQSLYDCQTGNVNEQVVAELLDNLDVQVSDDEISDDGVDSEKYPMKNDGTHYYIQSISVNGEELSFDNRKERYDIYISVLKKIGVDIILPQMASYHYHRNNADVVTKQNVNISKKQFSYIPIANGWFLMKGVVDDTLIAMLENAVKDLNLNVIINKSREYRKKE